MLMGLFLLNGLIGGGHAALAQSVDIEFITDPPNIQTLVLDRLFDAVTITIRDAEQNAEYSWSLEGPGALLGEKTLPATLYEPPERLDVETAVVTISVTVTAKGRAMREASLTFTLMTPTPVPSPSPTPTATPTPTPTPTPEPEPIRIHQILFKTHDDTYYIPAGKSMVMVVDLGTQADAQVTLEGIAIRGKIRLENQDLLYTAPDTSGKKDIVTIKVIDSETGAVLLQKALNIHLIEPES